MPTKHAFKFTSKLFILLALSSCCFADGVAAWPVAADVGSDPKSWAIGWAFAVSSRVTVTGLAYADTTGAGLNESHIVGIFDAASSALLVSGTVPAGPSTRFQNGFRVLPVNYVLNPGTYVMAALRQSDADPVLVRAQSIHTVPQITYIEERETLSDVFTMPKTNFPLVGAGDFGPSFTIAEDNGGGRAITGVTNSGSFQPGFAGGTYVSIFGTGLSATTRLWGTSDFAGGKILPTSLDGVSVTVGGVPAYVEYVSANQINILTPDLSSGNGIPIIVKSPGRADIPLWVGIQAAAPAFFTWPTGNADSGKYVVAQHADYSLIGKAGLVPSRPPDFTTPARAGETIILYGTGFGPTSPPALQGVLPDRAYAISPLPTATVGGLNATVAYAGLVPTLAGLYQVNMVLPADTPSGDMQVVVKVNGVSSPPALITVGQ